MNPPVDTGRKNLASNFPFPSIPEGTLVWRPEFKDIVDRHLTKAHIGQENSPVAALIENNAILPSDVKFYDQQKFVVLVLRLLFSVVLYDFICCL